jgi:hypothetical protein
LCEGEGGGFVEVGQGGDLPGKPAQVGGVVVGPFCDGAVCGAAVAFGLYAGVAGGARLVASGGAAQVPAFGGLSAGHPRRGCERPP